jgi:hypothetical protein
MTTKTRSTPVKDLSPRSRTPQRPRAKAAVPVQPAVRVIPETCFAGGKLWKMSGRNGVAFVYDASLAMELLKTDPKNLPKTAMAVYYDKKGRAFAWQVRFDTDRWDEVTKRLG